jgi:predicted aspartyl protease
MPPLADEISGEAHLDVEVAIMPNMQGEALLGMNALRRFRLEQSDGVLTLTTR